MMEASLVPLDELVGALSEWTADFERRRRVQAAVWRKEPVDYLPLLIGGGPVPEMRGVRRYNLEEQFFSPEKMLREALYGMLSIARSGSEGVPSVRPNLGTGLLPTVMGAQEDVFPDKMPWVQRRPSVLEQEAFEPVDLADKGLMPRALDYLDFFRETLQGAGNVYIGDTQAPFDIAHLVAGNDIFTDIYDDPARVHRLVAKSTAVYIECTRLMKEHAGEPPGQHYHSGLLYSPTCGVRACEDTSTLLSHAVFLEFSLPYLQQALAPFQGWVHWCGDGNHLLEDWMALPEVKGINMGDPQMHDYPKLIALCREHDCTLFGSPPRLEQETLEHYYRRVLAPLEGEKAHLLFYPCGWRGGESAAEQLEFWRKLQNEN